MKRILILVAISLFLCSTASAFQGGGGESTKKKPAAKKKALGTKSANTTPPSKPPAAPGPTRTVAPTATKEQAADRERQYEAIRIAGVAEHTRVEQGIVGQWSGAFGSHLDAQLTITKDGTAISGVLLSAGVREILRGELLDDNRLMLTSISVTRISGTGNYSPDTIFVELGQDGGSLKGSYRDTSNRSGTIAMTRRFVQPVQVFGPGLSIHLGNDVTLELVRINAGSFQMGSLSCGNIMNLSQCPRHQVTISQWFYIGKYEVTQAQWQAVMSSKPSDFKNCGGNCPVEQVSWDDVKEFIERLNARRDENTYRLPTEAEWEYAARAGTTGDYAGNLDEMAWYYKNARNTTHPVGTKSPNAWGLYDMHGNVFEWVRDWLSESYYSQSPSEDPPGPGSGSYRVLRGGSWYSGEGGHRSASRHAYPSEYRKNYLGFRVVAAVRIP